MNQPTYVLVGGGLAASSAAFTLRRQGFDGRLVLVGEEIHLPYERPPLSKKALTGTADSGPQAVYPDSWYAENEVELDLGTRVARVLAHERAVELEDGRCRPADGVLLATGGRPRQLPGLTSQRMLSLRTFEDAQQLSSCISRGDHLVIIGAGFIGTEVAASAAVAGAKVTLIDVMDTPFGHMFGVRMGQMLAEIHREQGVDLRTGQRVLSIDDVGDGVVVEPDAGARIEADVVVVGIGMIANDEVAQVSGLATHDGVLVDEFCRSSVPEVLAAGDVANQEHAHAGRRLRVEHYDNAINQGATAARTMLGRPRAHTEPHWFWSDQYDHNIQYAGAAEGWDEVVTRGSVEARSFTTFYLRERRLQAVLGFNRGWDVRAGMRLIGRGDIDPAALADESTDLRALARAVA